LKEKFLRRNLLLKGFFVCTILMILGIIYLRPLNSLFTTTPILDLYIWGIIILFSILTTLIRAIFGDNFFFSLKSEKQIKQKPATS